MKKNQTCVVRDCDSTEFKNPDLKFYPLPKEENVKKKWLKAINRSEEELNKRSKVCSKHFKNTDYTVTRFNYTVGNKNDAKTDKSVCKGKVSLFDWFISFHPVHFRRMESPKNRGGTYNEPAGKIHL